MHLSWSITNENQPDFSAGVGTKGWTIIQMILSFQIWWTADCALCLSTDLLKMYSQRMALACRRQLLSSWHGCRCPKLTLHCTNEQRRNQGPIWFPASNVSSLSKEKNAAKPFECPPRFRRDCSCHGACCVSMKELDVWALYCLPLSLVVPALCYHQNSVLQFCIR